MIQLTDEEIEYEIKYVAEHNDLPLEVTLKALLGSGAKAQLKKVVEWGDTRCDGDERHYGSQFSPPPLKRNCPECWQALLEEVKE